MAVAEQGSAADEREFIAQVSGEARTDAGHKTAYAIAFGRFVRIAHGEFGKEVKYAGSCKCSAHVRKHRECSYAGVGNLLIFYADRCAESPCFVEIVAYFGRDRKCGVCCRNAVGACVFYCDSRVPPTYACALAAYVMQSSVINKNSFFILCII